MTNNELLLNISDLLDKKISPIYDKLEKVKSRIDNFESRMDNFESRMDNFESRMDNFADILNNQIFPNIKLINLKLENDILPRLQTIEDCYLSTYKRYQSGVEHFDSMELDIQIMKNVLREHSNKLQKTS